MIFPVCVLIWMTWLAKYQLFCFKHFVTSSLQYDLQCHMNVAITASGGLNYGTGTAIQSNTSSHQFIVIKTKSIITVFHLRRLSDVAQRETFHVFVTLPSHLSPFVGCLFQFELTFNWLLQDLPQIPFFFCNSDQHNSAIQAFHHPPELNCHPERWDNTFMPCQNECIIQSRTLSFEKLIAVADTHCVSISAINP